MDFTVVDDIKEKAASVSELAVQANSFSNKGMDTAKNFVCVQILNIYTTLYITAGQLIAIPNMAIKIAKIAIKHLDSAVIASARESFEAATISLINAQSPQAIYYDPWNNDKENYCRVVRCRSRIQEDPTYAQQALHAMQAAKNCPLLSPFTSTSGFNSAFNVLKLYDAMSNVSLEDAGALLATAVADLATSIIDNLASALVDTAFGALNNARNMYNSALKQTGITDIFRLLGVGQSCLMDLCDDDSVLYNLENMPLAPYLAKAGGFVAENLKKVDNSYFTFTFDFDKSTGADQLSEDQLLDTTTYKLKHIVGAMPITERTDKELYCDILMDGFETLISAIDTASIILVNVYPGMKGSVSANLYADTTLVFCTVSSKKVYTDTNNIKHCQYILSRWSRDTIPDFFNAYVKELNLHFHTATKIINDGYGVLPYEHIHSGSYYCWYLFYAG